jgi:hypothetical protein
MSITATPARRGAIARLFARAERSDARGIPRPVTISASPSRSRLSLPHITRMASHDHPHVRSVRFHNSVIVRQRNAN